MILPRRKSLFSESLITNNRTYGYYFERLTELALSRFEWENLPSSIDARFLELSLFMNGTAVFYRDEGLGDYLALPVIAAPPLDVYNVPTNRTAYASNGYQYRNLSNKDSVLIYNNFTRTNSAQQIQMLSKRLYNLDRIIDVNANAQKTPIMVQCDENERLTLLNLYQKFDGNQPFIFGSKNLDLKSIQALSTNAPYIADKIMELKSQIWNDALSYLGIANVSFQKKERLITDEVTRGEGGTVASRYSQLETRRQACRQINEMFGLSIWCRFRDNDGSKEEEDESIYDAGEDDMPGADT